MSSTGVNYAYVIRLNWVQGDKSNDYVLGVCSSIRNLKHALLEIILNLQTKYNHVEENFARAYLSSHYQTEYHKSFEEVSAELKDFGYCSMIKYCNSPDKYEGILDSEHVSYELTIEKVIMNTLNNPVQSVI